MHWLDAIENPPSSPVTSCEVDNMLKAVDELPTVEDFMGIMDPGNCVS